MLLAGACKRDEPGPTTPPDPPPLHARDPEPAEPQSASATAPPPPVARRLASLRRCYDDALRRRPGVAGRMTYTIRIDDLGVITEVIVEEDGLGDPAFTDCTRTKIAAWRFASAPEDGEVTFSVVYTPSSAPPP